MSALTYSVQAAYDLSHPTMAWVQVSIPEEVQADNEAQALEAWKQAAPPPAIDALLAIGYTMDDHYLTDGPNPQAPDATEKGLS